MDATFRECGDAALDLSREAARVPIRGQRVLSDALDTALAMIERGKIVDAKTIMLLQHAALKGLCRAA